MRFCLWGCLWQVPGTLWTSKSSGCSTLKPSSPLRRNPPHATSTSKSLQLQNTLLLLFVRHFAPSLLCFSRRFDFLRKLWHCRVHTHSLRATQCCKVSEDPTLSIVQVSCPITPQVAHNISFIVPSDCCWSYVFFQNLDLRCFSLSHKSSWKLWKQWSNTTTMYNTITTYYHNIHRFLLLCVLMILMSPGFLRRSNHVPGTTLRMAGRLGDTEEAVFPRTLSRWARVEFGHFRRRFFFGGEQQKGMAEATLKQGKSITLGDPKKPLGGSFDTARYEP